MVDLQTCKPGDILVDRKGNRYTFHSIINYAKVTFPYLIVDKYHVIISRTRRGFYYEESGNCESEYDIVEIMYQGIPDNVIDTVIKL